MLAFLTGWLGPHRDIRILQTVTLLRSMGQGIALVDISLFLKDLGWSGGAIGAMFAGAGVVRTILTLFAGELNALLGAKRYLLLYEAIAAAAALAVSVCSNAIVLDIAMIVAGLGSGHSGSGGPTFAIERSWLAAYARHNSHRLFHINALLGYIGLGAGCLLACLPSVWSASLPGPNGYRPIFLLITLLTTGCMFFIWRMNGGRRKQSSSSTQAATADKTRNDGIKLLYLVAGSAILIGLSVFLRMIGLQQVSLYVPIAVFLVIIAVPNLKLLTKKKFATMETTSIEEVKHLANLLSGVTSTLTSTMTSYWFAVKFAASLGWIGAVMGVSYVAAGLWSLMTPTGSDKPGTVRSVIVLQCIAILFLLALPWTSSFWVAAVLEVGCTACSLGTRGNRTMIMMEDSDR